MKVGTARGFVTTDYQPPELRPNGASRALSQVRQLERKEETKAYSPDDELFVKRQTSVKDWPVFSD
jgi:ribosomal protein S12